jgi:pyrophosphatase PpaX
MKIKAVLFDLDGTLRDTREVIYPAMEHALKIHAAYVPTREDMAAYIHHHTEVHKNFAADVPLNVFTTTLNNRAAELMATVAVYEGVIETLGQLRLAGYKTAIVSSAINVPESLQALHIDTYFDTLVGGEDTIKHKPDPEPVVFALHRLEMEPRAAVMVGDLAADVQAAKAAGVKAVVGVTHGFGSRTSLEEAGADYLIDQLSELPDILKKLG